jgi:hypothetical protein
MLRRNHLGVYSANLPADLDRRLGLARIFDRVPALLDWAAARAPRGATVWVVPSGGSTYARA